MKPMTFRAWRRLAAWAQATLILGLPFLFAPNSRATLSIYVIAARNSLHDRVTRLRFTLENIASHEIRVVQEAPFVYPEQSDKGVEL